MVERPLRRTEYWQRAGHYGPDRFSRPSRGPKMEFLYLAVLIFTLLLLAYNRVPLLIAIAIMVSLTVIWTE
jgi:hypothetical protein